MKISINSGKSGGFSLIEVTLAMAIAAVGVVTLLGMVPQGMNTMREAGDEAIVARIHQQVLNELQMADFDALDRYHEMEIYYDDQGEELGNNKEGGGSAKGTFKHVYSARIAVPQAIGGRAPESVGGASFSGMSFDKMATFNLLVRPVIIEVAAVGGMADRFDWGAPEYRNMIHTYQTNVVKMGHAFQ